MKKATVIVLGIERTVDIERGFEIWVNGKLKMTMRGVTYEEAWETCRDMGGTLKYRLEKRLE